ncbi:MAG: molybdate ABC transporter substrate-binding protein [Gemmatimonadota bacterium]
MRPWSRRASFGHASRRLAGTAGRLPVVALIVASAGCGEDGPRSSGSSSGDGGSGQEVRVAVASSFAGPHERLAEAFTSETGIGVRASVGSTGGLYAQIRNGAPHDVFLAADRARPRSLVRQDFAVAGSRCTYAIGRLALAGAAASANRTLIDVLRDRRSRHVALADSEVAPYGAAAREVLRRTGLEQELADRLVTAENVGQAHRYVVSGAAGLGFVAAGHVAGRPEEGHLLVDDSLHAPIRQDAVLLTRARDPEAARRYLSFLGSGRAKRVLERFGYRAAIRGDRVCGRAAGGADP